MQLLDLEKLQYYDGKIKNYVAKTYAPLASPSFTGTPTSTTPSAGDSSTKIATTKYVQTELGTAKVASAGEFTAAKSVTLSGDVTGTASSKGGWSIAATLASSGVTADTYGPSANASPAHSGTFTVPKITVDAKGRVTSASNITITLPASGNVDTKVTQTVTANTDEGKYPILAKNVTATATITDTSRFVDGITIQPSTGAIQATKFIGAVEGNASTATKLATARNINGTSFNGTSAITTANWGTARNISISDADGTNTGDATSVNGSAAVTLKLPSTIKASLEGNASSADSVPWSGIDGKPSTFAPSSHNQASSTINAMTGYSKPSSTGAIATTDSLNAAIGKLEKALDGKAASSHNQASNTINAMTGYSKPSSTSAIGTSDTLNAAIGKLEKALDGKADSGSYAAASHNHDASNINSGTLNAARIPNLDASKITSGTIDIARLPAGALERLVTVANQTARFALTSSDVQLGDTVRQSDTGLMYYVVDTSKLSSADGYAEYTAGAATSVPWSGVTSKPSTFAPAAHNQASNTINAMTGYSKPSSTSAIGTSDTLNAAIGKLEKAIDGKAAAATTLAGYNISDAKIASGVITLGSNTITPLTSSSSLNAAKLTGTAAVNTTGKATTAGTADKVASSLTLKLKSGMTEGTDLYTFNGSGAKTLDIKQGSNVTLTAAEGSLTIAAKDTVYTHPTTSGNKHVPSGGSSGQFLGWDSDGTAKWVANPNSDTKNTAGSTDTSSKIFLVGATSQAANPQTYSHDTAYVGTDGCLYSGGTKVLTAHQSLANYVTLTGAQTISGAKTFTGEIIGINKNDVADDANNLYSTTAGSKLTYYTTTNGGTTLTNVPAAVNTTLESRTIRRLSDSDWVVEQICHNSNGLYYRKGNNGTWSAWKTFAFTDSNITGNAATVTGTAGTSTLSWNTETTLYTVGGHAIKAKLPANPNADTKVKQYVGNTSTERPILSRYTIDEASQTANYVVYDTGVTNNPNKHTLTASGGFVGKLSGTPEGTTFVDAVTEGKALVNATTTGYGGIWNAPTKNYRVGCSTYPSSGDDVRIAYSVTNANVTAGTNTVAKSLTWNADSGTLTATAFSGPLTGNASTATKLATARSLKTKLDSTTAVTFDGSAAQDAIPVTGTLPVANGGTGQTSVANIQAGKDVDGNAIKTTYAKLASPALTGTPTAPTASNRTNSTQIATTAFVANNAAKYLGANTTIYASSTAAGDGSGSSAANAMSLLNLQTYLASARMQPLSTSINSSYRLTVLFVPTGSTYGDVTFDFNKMPGIRYLTIGTSTGTASTTSNYTTNSPLFGNITVSGSPLSVTINNIQSTGTITACYGAQVTLGTYAGFARLYAHNYGRIDVGNGTYNIHNAGLSCLCYSAEYGQIILNSATMAFNFREQCYFTTAIFGSDAHGRLYVNYGRAKFTGTKPIVSQTISGTKTGTSATAAGTAAKAVALADGQTFTLANNAVAYVTFDNTNTAANPTLNINSTGAKPIYYNGAAIPAGYLNKHVQYKFTYNGTQYVCGNVFQRVEQIQSMAMLSYASNYNTTYNSGEWNWDGFSRYWGNGCWVNNNFQGNLTGNVTGNVTGNLTGNAATATKLPPQAAAALPTGNLAQDGLQLVEVYNNSYPYNYGNVINVQGTTHRGAGQLFLAWSGNDNGIANIYYRNKRDSITTWSDWKQIAFTDSAITGNAGSATKLATARNINGTSFDGTAAITTANWGTARNISISDSDGTNTGSAVSVNGSANATLKLPATIKASITGNVSGSSGSCTGNAATATKLATARKINGVSFDGSADITVADSTKLPLAGGTMTGNITMSASKSIIFDLSATTPTASTVRNFPIQFKSQSTAGNYAFTQNPFFEIPVEQTTNYGMGIGFSGSGLTIIGGGEAGRGIVEAESLTGGTEKIILASDGAIDIYTNCNTIANRVKTTIDTAGNFSGNAATATKLATARTINGVSFDGSANITVADSTKLPLAGGTMTGQITYKVGSITRGTAPSSSQYPWGIRMVDNANVALSGLYYEYLTDKTARSHLMCYQGTTNANTWKSIGIGYDTSGNPYTWAPTPAFGNNTTNIATTEFVYKNAAKHFAAAQTIYVAKAATGNGSGLNTSNYMALADLRNYLATIHMHSSTADMNGSYSVTLLFKAGDSFGSATFDATKMPGIRNLVLNTSTGTASTTSNYSTNSPTFGSITVTGGISVTIRNLNCTGRISAQYGAYVAVDTYIGLSSLHASNWAYVNVAKNMVIDVCDAHTDYLFAATNSGILAMWPGATVTINFREQCWYTRCLFTSSANGTIYVGYSSFKLTGTKPMTIWASSGTLTGTSETAAGTAAKVVPLADGQTFTLTTNATAKVRFTNDNTAANPTLNINSTGAKAIWWNGAAVAANMLAKNITYDVKYDGTRYVIQNVLKRLTNNDYGVFRSTGNYDQTYNSGSWNFGEYTVSYGNGIENSNWRGNHIGSIQQNVTTSNNTYPILFCGTANATANATTYPFFGSGVKINPSTSTVYATTFSGAFSGNASTATKLATARTINGVSFDGSANITVADSTKVAKAGDTMTGALTISKSGEAMFHSKSTGNSTEANNWELWCGIGASGKGGFYDNTRATYVFERNPDGTVYIRAQKNDKSATGTYTFGTDSKLTATTFVGALSGNASSATITKGNKGTGSYVNSIKTGNALVNADNTSFGTIFNAPTKNYRVGCATWPDSNDNIVFYSITNANVSSSTNTVNKSMTWNGDTGVLSATGFSGPLTGNVTGNVTGNCSGSSGSCTGNAATATTLKTARTINGVSFDGSANITVADSTKLPLAGGTMTGDLNGTTVIVSGSFAKKHPSITKGTNPSATSYWTLTFADKNGTNYSNNCLGMLETSITSAGVVSTYIRAMKNAEANSTNAQITAVYDTANSVAYATCPTPASATENSTKIATTAWCRTATGNFACNSATATKFASSQSVTLTGAITGTASSQAGWSVSTVWRSCMVGQSGSTNTNPWYKVATFAVTTTNDDIMATFLVEDTYSSHKQGILKVHVRTDGSKVISSAASDLIWLSHTGFTLAEFVLVCPTAASSTVEIWTKIATAYMHRRFTVLSEGSRSGTSVRWTLLNASTAGQAASITTSGTQIASTLAGQSASCTGNAATATKLATARSLWGNNFDGSAAITGTITGTPSIEFKPAATTSNNGGYLDFHYNQSTADYTSRIIESASGTLSINNVTITTGKVVTATTFTGALSGNASTATKLATARTINGVSFDGSANITVADSTKLPLAGGTLTGDLVISKSSPLFTLKATNVTKNTAPAANYTPVAIEHLDSASKRLWGIYYNYNTDKTSYVRLIVNKGNTTDNTWTGIGVGYDKDGNWFTYAPTPAAASNTTHIATTAFVKAQGYITASGSITGNAATATKLATARTINGVSFDGSANITVADSTKVPLSGGTMTGSLTQKHTGLVKGSAVSAWTCRDYRVIDNSGDSGDKPCLSWWRTAVGTDKTVSVTINAFKFADESTASASIGIHYPVNGDAYTSAPTPPTADNTTKIATTAFVKAQGYITGSGNTTGSSGSCTGNAATATTLKTARKINGVSFNGSADITVADSTKLPLAGGTMTGNITLTDKSILFDNSTLDYNAAPSANVTQGGLYWRDKNDKYVARMLYYKNTDKTMGMSFGMCRHGTTNSDGYTTLLGMAMNADGSVKYASCPTPAAGDSSTKIATTAFVASKFHFSTSAPSDSTGANGDVWYQYV